MPAEITCRAVRSRRHCAGLRADAYKLLELLGLEQAELSLVLAGDRAIRRLNREFRDRDEATDVLSFPQFDGPVRGPRAMQDGAPPAPLGDIVISIDTARRQAFALGQTMSARLRTLLIHGLLHLLGYEHERSQRQARRMFAREHELAERLEALRPCGTSGANRRSGGSRRANDRAWSPAAMPPHLRPRVRKRLAGKVTSGRPEPRTSSSVN